jgi:AI-2 transport protein TqsA
MDNAAPTTGLRSQRARSSAITLVLVVAGLSLALVTIRSLADILGPIFLALVITVTLHPMRTWIERRGLPEWACSLIMLVSAYLLLFLLMLALIVSIGQLAGLIPEYSDQIQEGIANAGNVLLDLGVKQDQIDAVVTAFDPGQLVDLAMSWLSGTLGVVGDLFFLLTVLLFITFDTDATRRSLASVRSKLPNVVDALGSFARGARSYMAVSATFGFIVAVIDGVVLYFMGVPGAFVWAVLAFVTNFIPNIGFVIGVIPPALLALLDGGVDLMIAVIVVYSVINFILQSIIQPRVVGDRVGLSPTLTFLSLVFWAWAIGPLGALLAVPLSLFARAFLIEADPGTRWALPVIAGRPVEEDPVDPVDQDPVDRVDEDQVDPVEEDPVDRETPDAPS